MKYLPLNRNIIVKPDEEVSAWASSQKQYAEGGIVVELPPYGWLLRFIRWVFNPLPIKVGDSVHFDSWKSVMHKDKDDNEVWYVPEVHIRGVGYDG